jgi:hypothetical protein
MTLRPALAVLSFTLGLCACADINRMTQPSPPPAQKPATAAQPTQAATNPRPVPENALAHLCADPTTEAFAAFTASLGSGAPGSDKAPSVSPAVREAIVMAALRAQWSSLMHDQLYRICEAYYNKAIAGPQVMQLLLRSQDVTLATVAVEHLTGAIALSAHASALGPAGGAPSSGTVQLRGLLDVARKNEDAKNAAVEADKQDLVKKKAILQEKQTAQSNAASRDSKEEKLQLAEATAQAERDVAAAAQAVKSAQDLANEAAQTRQAIEKGLETALLEDKARPSAAAAAPAPPVPPVQLGEGSVAEVAAAVKEMVLAIVNRSYLADGCFALLTADRPGPLKDEEAQARAEQVKFCMGIVQSSVTR